MHKVGNSLCVNLPKEALARLGAKAGDKIVFTEKLDGAFQLTVGRVGSRKQLRAAESAIGRYRGTLRRLT